MNSILHLLVYIQCCITWIIDAILWFVHVFHSHSYSCTCRAQLLITWQTQHSVRTRCMCTHVVLLCNETPRNLFNENDMQLSTMGRPIDWLVCLWWEWQLDSFNHLQQGLANLHPRFLTLKYCSQVWPKSSKITGHSLNTAGVIPEKANLPPDFNQPSKLPWGTVDLAPLYKISHWEQMKWVFFLAQIHQFLSSWFNDQCSSQTRKGSTTRPFCSSPISRWSQHSSTSCIKSQSSCCYGNFRVCFKLAKVSDVDHLALTLQRLRHWKLLKPCR